jgi:hypothetical protein
LKVGLIVLNFEKMCKEKKMKKIKKKGKKGGGFRNLGPPSHNRAHPFSLSFTSLS